MKILLSLFFLIITHFYVFSQTPQAFKYQAVTRDNVGNAIVNQVVSFRISILRGNANSVAEYTETHIVTTNQVGLASLEIGKGNVISGLFEEINWGNDSYFLQIEMDESGGDAYQLMGTSQLLSVPYSLNSKSLTLTSPNGVNFEITVDDNGDLLTQKLFQCGELLYDSIDGQTYMTVKIGGQCWMAENLNVGTRIDGVDEMLDNGIIEKYCYSDNDSDCDTYGGLYQWDELMQYTGTNGAQGICPTSWHIPSNEEWKRLEGEVDSQYGYPDPEWDSTGNRGFDAGLNLKSTFGWAAGGNGIDLYGFTGLPGGVRNSGTNFYSKLSIGYFWSSEESGDYVLNREIYYNNNEVGHTWYFKKNGLSVRCIKDSF